MQSARKTWIVWMLLAILCCGSVVLAQQLARRLILRDGTYQLAIKWEVKGDRVRYLSAERGEWEEVPKSMVDWDATEKYEKDRASGVTLPEAADLDKELEAQRKNEDLKNPQVAPGLRLTPDAGLMLLDLFHGEPELVELQQSGGEINANRKANILRAAMNPVASAKQSIEIPGAHSGVQSHAALPSVYVNLTQLNQTGGSTPSPDQPWDRFRIVRMQSKQGKRIVGDIKVAIFGKVTQEQKLVPTTASELSGGWVKVTPTEELAPGEYAVVEMLGKEGINLYVWDFGVNPAAPANGLVVHPDASASTPSDKVPTLKRPE